MAKAESKDSCWLSAAIFSVYRCFYGCFRLFLSELSYLCQHFVKPALWLKDRIFKHLYILHGRLPFQLSVEKTTKKLFYCVESNRANAFLAHQAKLWCQTKTMSCIVPFTEPLTADIEFKWCVSVIVELYNFVQIRMFGAFHNLHLILKGQCGPVSACLGIPLLPAELQCLPACQCLSVQQRQSCDCRIWFYCLQNAARYFIHFEWAFQTIRGQSFLPAVNM